MEVLLEVIGKDLGRQRLATDDVWLRAGYGGRLVTGGVWSQIAFWLLSAGGVDFTLRFVAAMKLLYTSAKACRLGDAAYDANSFLGLQFQIKRAASTSRSLEDSRFTLHQFVPP